MGGLGAPMTVVGRPVDQKRSEAKEARRGRASDEYWCVIDVDQHANLGPAVEKAITNGISVAASNPCVELWFILHYQHQAAEIDRKRAQAISKELLKCDKVLDERALRRWPRRSRTTSPTGTEPTATECRWSSWAASAHQ